MDSSTTSPCAGDVRTISYSHVIWDWNGTLFDDAWLCLECMNELLARHGLGRLSRRRYKEIFRFPVRNYYLDAGFDPCEHSFEELGAEFMHLYRAGLGRCRLQAGAASTLSALADLGIEQCLLSAYKDDWLNAEIARFGIHSFFSVISGADDFYADGKGDRGRRLLAELNVRPEDALFVGDTTHDFEVAQSVGAGCVLFDGGNQSRERLEACGTIVIDDLSELVSILLP